jgi:hypothetical protein
MKIELTKKLNMYGKSDGYTATFGSWQESGKTKEEAKQNLITAIEWFMDESDFMPVIKDANTRIVMLNRDFNGYSITAIDKETASQSFNNYGRITLFEAKKYLQNHVNSYLEIGA